MTASFHLALVLCLAALSPAANAFALRPPPSTAARAATAGRRTAAAPLSMGALSEGDKVLVLGSGPVMAIAAKHCAAAGYETTIIGGADSAKYREMMFGPESPAPPQSGPGGIRILESVEGEGYAEFNRIATSVDGVVVANDRDRVVPSDSMLDAMIPPANINLKRIVVMSRNLNGKGLGPFAVASKLSANAEVWAGGNDVIAQYRQFEAKVRSKAAEVGGVCDSVIVRAGTLKGGGPGDETNSEPGEGIAPALSLTRAFYDQYSRDIVNWPLLFDVGTLGVALTPGDTAEGPGFRAAFTATSDGACAGDSARHNIGAAIAASLSREALGGRDFGVTTTESRSAPSSAQWDAEFSKIV